MGRAPVYIPIWVFSLNSAMADFALIVSSHSNVLNWCICPKLTRDQNGLFGNPTVDGQMILDFDVIFVSHQVIVTLI